jgi:hypothetical protein
LSEEPASFILKTMRRFYLLLITSLFTSYLTAQCPETPVHLNQNKINEFPTKYPGCTEIEGNLFIDGSDVTDLSPLIQLRGVTGHLIIRTKRLKTLDGLEGILYVNGNIQIENNDSLLALYAFNDKYFTSVGGDIHFLGNPMLTTLEGFQYLTHIYAEGELSSAGLWFFDNPSLKHVDELANLTHVGKGIYFYGSDNLESVAGFSNIKELPDDLVIHTSPLLTNLQGLHNLEVVNGNFQIDKTGVIDFDDLYNLRHIGGALAIVSNDHLTSIDGLSKLDPNSLKGDRDGYRDHLEILFNPLLSECSIDAICNMLVRDDITFDIQYNAEGCNDDAEVLNNCSSTSVDDMHQAGITLYPNPSSGSLIIESEENTVATLLNLNGSKLMHFHVTQGINEYDVSFLPSGKYIIRYKNGALAKIVIR